MSNPILNENRFSPQERILDGEPMTISGTVNKVLMLLVALYIKISNFSIFMHNR